MNILFLGYGKMGQALAHAWSASAQADKIVAIDPLVDPDGIHFFQDQADLPQQNFDLIVVAVKPNYAQQVLENLNPNLLQGSCIISIMAGVSIDTLRSCIADRDVPIIRVMPNTPVLAQAGCCVLYSADLLAPQLKDKINQLFSTVGYANWLDDEAQLHAVTALSGSGPAYIHLFTEAMAQAGIQLGLAPQLALDLAKQTAYGAAVLQSQATTDLIELRRNVTSPNGTTHAAIETFEQSQALRNLVQQALQAAADRSVELSKL